MIVKIVNELSVEIYDSQTVQTLAVIDCLDKCTADNIYAVIQQAYENGDIINVCDY